MTSHPFPSSHTHDHEHHHHNHSGGHHHHAPTSFGTVFILSILLNSAYIVGEASWGFWAHSLSLLADAGHNLSDVLGLGAAWLAQSLAKRAPSQQFTYGLKRATILTALGNAIILLLVTGGIIWEAITLLFHPETVHGQTVSVVAFIGILVNGSTALLLMRGADHDLNMRGAFLHMASDALMALSVVIAGGLITLTGYNILDPVISLVVSAIIVWSTWSLLHQSLGLALDGVPAGTNLSDVAQALRDMPGIDDLHHLHVWPVSTTETALTVHLILSPFPSHYSLEDGAQATQTLLTDAAHILQERFSIHHPTFQVETRACSTPCATETCSASSRLTLHHTH